MKKTPTFFKDGCVYLDAPHNPPADLADYDLTQPEYITVENSTPELNGKWDAYHRISSWLDYSLPDIAMVCTDCTIELIDGVHDTEVCHCPKCGKVMTWASRLGEELTEVKFDYATQTFRNHDGTVDTTNDGNGMFPCPKCQGPAKLNGVSAHGEYHTCIQCSYPFTVR